MAETMISITLTQFVIRINEVIEDLKNVPRVVWRRDG